MRSILSIPKIIIFSISIILASRAHSQDCSNAAAKFSKLVQQSDQTHGAKNAKIITLDKPLTKEEYSQLVILVKQMNDAVYLRLMEEGLHGKKGISVANLPSHEGHPLPSLPESLKDIKNGQQDIPVGIKLVKSSGKLSLVFNGTNLDPKTQTEILDKINQSVKDGNWKKWKSSTSSDEISFLRMTNAQREKSLDELATLVGSDMHTVLRNFDHSIILPLQRFERMPYFNFKTGKPFALTLEQKERIKVARDNFVAAIRELDGRTLRNPTYPYYKKKNQKMIAQEIESYLKKWAQESRLSELFQEF